METTARSLLKPVVVAVCVLVLAGTQVVARSKTEEVKNHFSASGIEISVPMPEVQTAAPTEKPRQRKASPAKAVAEPVSAPAAAPVAYHAPNVSSADKIALLIGVNKAPGSTPLEGSITDVNNTKKMLLNFGFQSKNIEVLTESKASRGNILGALDRFAGRSRSRGIAVFLLATHSGQSGGDLTFATGGGGRVSRHELASRLGRVQGKLFSLLPTCYSAGYALPGVVGKNRIAVFSSSQDDYTWQLGSAGSWLVLYMVRYGMLERSSSDLSVEGAFAWTKKRLLVEAAHRAPIMSDGIDGKLVLGKSEAGILAAKPKPVATPKPLPATPAPTPVPTTRPCGLLGALFGCR